MSGVYYSCCSCPRRRAQQDIYNIFVATIDLLRKIHPGGFNPKGKCSANWSNCSTMEGMGSNLDSPEKKYIPPMANSKIRPFSIATNQNSYLAIWHQNGEKNMKCVSNLMISRTYQRICRIVLTMTWRTIKGLIGIRYVEDQGGTIGFGSCR